MSYEDIRRMTKRDVQLALMAIDKRTHNNFAMRAALHGAKIPVRHSLAPETAPKVNTEFNKKEHDAAEVAMKRAMERVKASRGKSGGRRY